MTATWPKDLPLPGTKSRLSFSELESYLQGIADPNSDISKYDQAQIEEREKKGSIQFLANNNRKVGDRFTHNNINYEVVEVRGSFFEAKLVDTL